MTQSPAISHVDRIHIKQEVLLVGMILVAAAAIRLFAFINVSDGALQLTGTCGQLFDEAKPLFDARNPLHFEVFFYPPVAPMIVASSGMLLQMLVPGVLDFASYCLLFNLGVSVAALLVVYMIGRQWSVSVGLAAMSFYAVTMIAVYSSDNVQMYPTFFSLLALYFFYKSVQGQATLHLVLMGAFLGLAVSSKYFPIMLVLMLVMVSIQQRLAGDVQVESRHLKSGESEIRANRRVDRTWNVMFYAVLISAIGICYVGLFHKDAVLSQFQVLYDRYPHDHSFAHHLPTVIRLYYMGLLGVGIVGCLAGLALYLPFRQGVMPSVWFSLFSKRHRLWLVPVASMCVMLAIALAIPAALNLNNYLKYTTWIAKTYASADGGFFPAGNPAPSYFLAYFPENLGLPLFGLSCMGMIYCLYVRDRKAILLLLIALPLYIALELSSVKVNRFAMDLMPLLCLLSAIFIVALMRASNHAVRIGSMLVFVFVLSYSLLYSLAWANLQRSLHRIPVETAGWIHAHVPYTSRLGMRADLWIAGSPNLLPDPSNLVGFEVSDYVEYPELILLPKSLYEIMKQYADLTRSGYTYRSADWSPMSPPRPAEADVLMDVVEERRYELIREFEQTPSIFGIRFGPQSLSGRTWLLEHTGSYGIRLYKKRLPHNQASVSSTSATK